MGNIDEDFSWEHSNPRGNDYDKASAEGNVREAKGVPVTHSKVTNADREVKKEEQYRQAIKGKQLVPNQAKSNKPDHSKLDSREEILRSHKDSKCLIRLHHHSHLRRKVN